jgi:hypothetical protein
MVIVQQREFHIHTERGDMSRFWRVSGFLCVFPVT